MELGILVALICVAIISAVGALSGSLNTSFGKVSSAITAAGS